MAMNAAQELANKRWNGTTPQERSQVAAVLAEGRQKIPPARRSEIARDAARKRWANKTRAPRKDRKDLQ